MKMNEVELDVRNNKIKKRAAHWQKAEDSLTDFPKLCISDLRFITLGPY